MILWSRQQSTSDSLLLYVCYRQQMAPACKQYKCLKQHPSAFAGGAGMAQETEPEAVGVITSAGLLQMVVQRCHAT